MMPSLYDCLTLECFMQINVKTGCSNDIPYECLNAVEEMCVCVSVTKGA